MEAQTENLKGKNEEQRTTNKIDKLRPKEEQDKQLRQRICQKEKINN